MGQKDKRGIFGDISRGIVFGMLSGIIVMLLLCFAGAGLIAKELLPQESMGIMASIICAAGMLIGSRVAIGKSGHGALPVSLGCAAASMLLLYFGRLMMKSDSAFGWQNIGITIAAAVAAALLWSGRKGKRR